MLQVGWEKTAPRTPVDGGAKRHVVGGHGKALGGGSDGRQCVMERAGGGAGYGGHLESTWVWLKLNRRGYAGFGLCLTLTSVPFWYQFFEPQPLGNYLFDIIFVLQNRLPVCGRVAESTPLPRPHVETRNLLRGCQRQGSFWGTLVTFCATNHLLYPMRAFFWGHYFDRTWVGGIKVRHLLLITMS